MSIAQFNSALQTNEQPSALTSLLGISYDDLNGAGDLDDWDPWSE